MVFSSKITPEVVAEVIRTYDPIKECASILRKSLMNLDYDLNDKFCDSSDLKDSWLNTRIPESFSNFFCVLFYVEPSKICLDNTSNETSPKTPNNWAVKAQSLLQTMYYILHHGKKKTPLHVMNAQAIHETCRSKTLITSFNHLGLCIGYDEVLRHRSALAHLTVTQSGDVPLPTHFSPDMYTISAFDNFDHTEKTFSGLGSTHDTVCVVFQDKPPVPMKKPLISETSVKIKQKRLQNTLPCQNLQPYIKPAKRPDLSDEYSVDKDLFFMNETEFRNCSQKDSIWEFSRIAHTVSEKKMTDPQIEQPSPSWGAFNSLVSCEDLQLKQVGFFPILPHSVTKYETVYTVLCNLNKVLTDLKQKSLAVACDEGVCCIAREIKLSRHKQFENLVLIMGSFHMTKVFIGCLGKYLRKSGASDILIESGLMGVNVTESALGGKHYVRGVKVMFILDEALFRLQVLAFFKVNEVEHYADELKLLQILQETLVTNDHTKIKATFDNINVDNLISEFQEFVDNGRKCSEMFLYWDNFRIFVSLLRNLIRADREGLWDLHLDTVQKMQPLLAVFDCINYQRWSSLYLEDMRNLPSTHPEMYESFKKGKHVVKRFDRTFSAVGADMALEQTINRSQKGPSGVIGMTKQKQSVAQWDLTYHELLQITNLHREITHSVSTTYNLHTHHELNKKETWSTNKKIVTVVQYVLSKENPFETPSTSDTSLHNLVSQVKVADEAKTKLLNVSKLGIELYNAYRIKRYVEKSARIWDPINRTNLPTFETQNKSLEKNGNLDKKSLNTEAHRIVQVAQVRGYQLQRLFQFELSDVSMLFDGNGLPVKSKKSTLTQELEKNLSKDTEINFQADHSTCVIIDAMNCLRKVVTKEKETFGDVATSYTTFTLSLSVNASRVDHVFDSYHVCSPKDAERLSRKKNNIILLSKVSSDVKLPVQLETFWPSSENKLLLQKYITEYINCLMVTEPVSQLHVLSAFSGSLEEKVCCKSIVSGIEETIDTLNRFPMEEGDFRMMVHAKNAAMNGLKKILFVSSDTDILVLALFHWNAFHTIGVNEIWVRAGVGDTTRLIPVHLLAEKLGKDLCQTLPALHALSGADYTSKFGTKRAAIACNPEQKLKDFGISQLFPDPGDRIMTLTEEYLVQLLKKGSSCKTLDEFRLWKYLHGKNVSLDELPPTSASGRGHILRAFFHTYLMIHCLDEEQEKLDPLKFGFEHKDNVLVPSTFIKLLPEDYIGACSCLKCSTSRCVCREAKVPCCLFCKCNSVDISKIDCKNPFIL